LTLLGGVTTAEKITLGYDATVNAGSATIALNGGALYLGSVGLVKNGVAPFAANINLTSGTLGAKNDWASVLPMTLPAANSVAIKAADAAGNARTITLNGVLGGAGGFAKTGAGALVLGATNTFTGDVDVNGGILNVSGSLAAGGTLDVNAGGILAGAGTINKAVALNVGGRISPGTTGSATLNAASLTWNGGGQLAFDLGASSDKLALTGALSKGAAGVYEFVFSEPATLPVGSSYTLATFGSTNFAAEDFAYSGLTGAGEFSITGGSLSFTVTSDGSGRAAFNAWMAPFGLPAGQNGPAHDPDGDGLSNLLESILALNPTSAEVDEIVVTKVSVGGVVYPALQFTRRQDRGDVVVDVRASLTLDATNTLGTTEVSATPVGDGTDLVVVRSNTPLSVEPRQFLRLFVKLH
jgi:autotransporter-associated beta strand protein